MRLFAMCLFFFLVSISCRKVIINSQDYTYSTPLEIQDGLHVGSLAAVGLDSLLLAQMTKSIVDEDIYNIHSVLIYKNGLLVYERYLCGLDEKHGKKLGLVRHRLDCLHDARSVSKSVVSACVGIALQKGLIKTVDEPVLGYFPDICKKDKLNPHKMQITVRNMLTMSSGLSWHELGKYGQLLNDETKMDLSLNPIKFVLKQEMASIPGTDWNYSGGNTQVLAEIVRRQSGLDIHTFARKFLFEPLGIQESEWVCLTLDKSPAAASGLRLRSRDLLKLGVLYLNSGVFNGQQILDADWVEESLASHKQRPSLEQLNIEDGGYGYQFWTYKRAFKGKNLDIVEAKGNGGQSIYICKTLNLVLVTTGGNYGQTSSNGNVSRILSQFVLPACQ
ncbi:beta-lactamase family protein [Marinilongibacter aquaticus]|uniref:serine hydrolase domain-containing protein n=1 Tax=Marinilongibacter aquaticus TaxID=2975157 RepID=UPI0021BD7653|nr:serine hydrolase [Marinilongibacter aquaticus]UBM60112.1 beta-lactamase family protein [Marinilongibacter aquaticus]